MRAGFASLPFSVVLILFAATASGQLVEVREDFSKDPGWDHFQNRIVGTDMPQVVQDFGWRRTEHTGSGAGEIGGRVENSRRQAYYAMPLGRPLTAYVAGLVVDGVSGVGGG